MTGEWIGVCCYKHDGEVHRIWEKILVIEEGEDFLVVGNDTARVIESDGRIWQVKEPAITVFFKKEWFNVISMIRENGIHFYCNIASPFIVKDNTILYIDYDIDVGMNPSGQIRILDEQEYARHKELMQYSSTLDMRIKEALHQVLELCRRRVFPFSDTKIYEYYQQFNELKKK
jgi:protein associated with RNAse G/E